MSSPNFQSLSLRIGGAPPADENVRARVHELLLAIYPPGPPIERRRDRRYPYPRLIRLTPVGLDGRTPLGPSTTVAGSTLSERGLGFYHPEPLAERRMICTLDAGDDRWLGLLTDLTWCRFTGLGWYESGGRFLDVVPAVFSIPKPAECGAEPPTIPQSN